MPIRVMTYNIHRAIGVDRRFRPERIVAILRHYDPDVVMLQEVDEGAPRSRELNLAKELAEEAGYPNFALGHNVSLKKGRYGNATLSRLPILRERNIDLSIAESWIRRGCQHTTLDLGREGHLEVFNLHLGLSARERAKQIGADQALGRAQRASPYTTPGPGGGRLQRLALAPAAGLHQRHGLLLRHGAQAGAVSGASPPTPPSRRRAASTASTTAGRCGWSPPTPAGCRSRAWRATICRFWRSLWWGRTWGVLPFEPSPSIPLPGGEGGPRRQDDWRRRQASPKEKIWTPGPPSPRSGEGPRVRFRRAGRPKRQGRQGHPELTPVPAPQTGLSLSRFRQPITRFAL